MKRYVSLAFIILMLLVYLTACGSPQASGDRDPAYTQDKSAAEKTELFEEKTVKNIKFSSDPDGYEYTFHASSIEKIKEYFSDIELVCTPSYASDITGMSWGVRVEYEDGDEDVITIGADGEHVFKDGRIYKAVNGKIEIDRLIDSLKDVPSVPKSITLTIAQTKESCVAFEYSASAQPYCLYAYDDSGASYRILWTDFGGLNENDSITVRYTGDIKALTYDEYPDGGWTPEFEIHAVSVTKNERFSCGNE